ncbi:hypothetical protein [Bdellovibrio sp. HCB337]|uniref:hypothetical protein n=1 Tax=Bdellovibrio sp. HCB337 TaxID=3394358 RepID=UPI0039A72EFC
MHQKIKNAFAILLIATAGLGVVANAAPAEKTTATLTRSAASGTEVSETLTKNIYRQESVQVPYTVQEPYQDTETYYENVPYQETESYYENVPYQDQETYTDYEEYYEQEYRCEERSRDERICHDKESCHIAPGTNPDGSPRRVCTTQPVCETITRRYQDCDYVPVRRTRAVERTRWVTRYRQELRHRTVTRYRQEQRTRTVTRYRDKEVCCKTEIRTVFDHQFQLPVRVVFPAETVLAGAEQETFSVEFTGSESSPSVKLTPKKVLFGYEVERQDVNGAGIVVTLKRVALYSQDQLGVATIKGLGLQAIKEGSVIRFTDEGLRPRVDTAYSYQVFEVGTTDILAQGSVVAQAAQVSIPLQVILTENKTYQVDIRLFRKGLPLAADIDTVISATQTVSSLKNASVYMDKSQIGRFEIRGEKEDSRLFFRDQAPKDEGVSTLYRIEVIVGEKDGQVVSTKEIALENMPLSTNNFYRLMLGSDLGVPSQILKDKVRDGKTISVRVTVVRQHVGLNEGVPVSLKIEHSSRIRKE